MERLFWANYKIWRKHFHEKFWHLIQAFPSIQFETTALALLTLAILLLPKRFFKRTPSPLVAMVATTLVQWAFHFEHVATVGSAFGGIPPSALHKIADFALMN